MRDRLLQSHSKWLSNRPFWQLRLLGLMAGKRLYAGNGEDVHVTRTNLHLVYPDKSAGEVDALLKAGLIEACRTYLEMPRIWSLAAEEIKELVTAHKGFDLFRRAQAFGKGVIVGAPYVGNWEFLARYLSTLSNQTLVSDSTPLSQYEQMVREGRSQAGLQLLSEEQEDDFVSGLAAGNVACLFSDVAPPEPKGTYAPLCKVPVATSSQICHLARRSGAIIVFALAERRKNHKGYRIHWILGPEEIYDADPVVSATAVNRAVRASMKRCPEQFFWGHRRFTRRLNGGDPYVMDQTAG